MCLFVGTREADEAAGVCDEEAWRWAWSCHRSDADRQSKAGISVHLMTRRHRHAVTAFVTRGCMVRIGSVILVLSASRYCEFDVRFFCASWEVYSCCRRFT